MGEISALAHSLAALAAIFLFFVWVVLLYHVAADISEGGARPGIAKRGIPGGVSAVLRRNQFDALRHIFGATGAEAGRCGQNAPLAGLHWLLRSGCDVIALDANRRSALGDDLNGPGEFCAGYF